MRVLAELHDADVSADDIAFLELDRPGDTAMRRHLAEQRSYYEWVVADGARSPLIERTFAWLEEHWPADEGDAVISWGDARIGNMMFRDFEPVAVLDWEMAAVGPREIDIAWMVYLHRFLDDIAVQAGLPGMPALHAPRRRGRRLRAGTPGTRPGDLDFYTMYAALRHAIVMSRVARRQVLFGEIDDARRPRRHDHAPAHAGADARRHLLEQRCDGDVPRSAPSSPADEGLCHQITDTFAVVATSDLSWTEKICAMAAAKDGSLQLGFGLGKYPNRNVMDGYAGDLAGRRADAPSGPADAWPPTRRTTVVGPIRYEVRRARCRRCASSSRPTTPSRSPSNGCSRRSCPPSSRTAPTCARATG